MIKESLRRKILVPLFVGGAVLGLLGSWITYQAALEQLRNEFIQLGQVLAGSIVELVNMSGGLYESSVGDLHLAIEDFVKLEPNVLAVMAATKDPFVMLVSTIHAGINSDELPVDTLTDIRVAIDEGRFGKYFSSDEHLTILLPLRRRDMKIGKGLLPVAVNPRPDGGTELMYASSDFRGAVLLHLDWGSVRRASAIILWRSVAITVMLISGALLFIYFLLQRTVLRPIGIIHSTMKQRELGDQAARVPTLSSDEIGTVAMALNTMLDSIEENEDRFRAVVENSPATIVLKDTEGRFLIVNKQWESWFMVKSGEAIGKTVHNFFPLEVADAITAHERQILEGLEPTERVFNITYPDGVTRDILSQKFPIIGDDGRPLGIGSIVTDITEYKRVERKLELERDLLHNLMANIPDAIYFKDLKHRYIRLNEAHARVLNIGSPKDAFGKRPEEFLSPDRAKLREEEEEKIFASGLPLIGRNEKVPQADDSVRWYSASKAPIRNRLGEIVGLVGITRDITEYVESNKRLRHLEKMDALGNLAGGIAHDFNNMLLPIMGLTNSVLKGLPEEGPDRQKLEKVVQASERAKGLVSQILAFSRQEDIKRENIDVYEVTCEVMELLRSTLPSTIEIKESLDEEAGFISGDAAQIETVILNLASNAADAMGGKPGALEFTVSRVDVDQDHAARVPGLRGGSYVWIEVRDTGSGMNDETLNKLFDPYYTTKAPGKGTGLGLAIVHGIVTKHEGAIDVSSELGVGTTFGLYFPLVSGREVHQLVSLAQGT